MLPSWFRVPFYKVDNQKGTGQQRWKRSKEITSDDAGNKTWIKNKWDSRKKWLLWNVDLAAVEGTLVAGKPEGRGKGALTDVNEESGCGEKGGSVLEDMKLAENTSFEEFSGMVQGVERAKGKMLEVGPK